MWVLKLSENWMSTVLSYNICWLYFGNTWDSSKTAPRQKLIHSRHNLRMLITLGCSYRMEISSHRIPKWYSKGDGHFGEIAVSVKSGERLNDNTNYYDTTKVFLFNSHVFLLTVRALWHEIYDMFLSNREVIANHLGEFNEFNSTTLPYGQHE